MVDTLIKHQAAELPWTSRRSWLVPGAALTAIFSWMFVVGLALQPVLPYIGIGLVVACYAAMIVASVMIHGREQRSNVLAWLMGAMATSAVVVLVVVLVMEADRLIGIGAL